MVERLIAGADRLHALNNEQFASLRVETWGTAKIVLLFSTTIMPTATDNYNSAHFDARLNLLQTLRRPFLTWGSMVVNS
jgi:hypothetical protein